MTKSRINNADGHEPSVNNGGNNAKGPQQETKNNAVRHLNASNQQGEADLAGEKEETTKTIPFDKCELI